MAHPDRCAVFFVVHPWWAAEPLDQRTFGEPIGQLVIAEAPYDDRARRLLRRWTPLGVGVVPGIDRRQARLGVEAPFPAEGSGLAIVPGDHDCGGDVRADRGSLHGPHPLIPTHGLGLVRIDRHSDLE